MTSELLNTTTTMIERGSVLLRGERVVYAALGEVSGPTAPALYVHGLGSDLTDLLEVATRVGAPALLLDLPGFGQSERVDREHSVARDAETCEALLEHLGVARALWVGCSYGGHVALRAALEHSRRVAGLVLVSSGGLYVDPPVHLAPMFDERLMAARAPVQVLAACDLLVARPCAATLRFRARRLAAHVGLPFEGHLVAQDYRAVARAARASLTDDAGRHLERVALPVELIHGAADPLVPLAIAEAARARLPRAALTTLSGVGHVPWLEAPARVAARVRRSLGRINSVARRSERDARCFDSCKP